MNENILIHFSGQDRPGLVAELTAVLASYNASVLDIGQAVVHETLSLGVMVEIPPEQSSFDIKNALLEKSEALKLLVKFRGIAKTDLDGWISSQGSDQFIVTILGRAIKATDLARVSTIIADHGLNIERMERLSGRLSLAIHSPDVNACIELILTGNTSDEASMRAAFLAAANKLKIDIAFQRESIFRRNRRLFVFDMDSTLIEGEVIDELAKLAGTGDEVAMVTESAMRGEIEFQESFRRRVALLRGLKETRVRELLKTIPLVEGAEQLIRTLKMLGYKTAILSGGFNFFARHLQERFGIDYIFANDLQVVNGIVTGEVSRQLLMVPARRSCCGKSLIRKTSHSNKSLR